jgi:hypothetical protein
MLSKLRQLDHGGRIDTCRFGGALPYVRGATMKDTAKDWPMMLFVVCVFSLLGWLGLNVATTLEGKGQRWVIEQVERLGR